MHKYKRIEAGGFLQGAEIGLTVLTRIPDLDHANVGSI
jgi:hypothetical protein